jgi:hypothetical protein
MPLNFVDLYDSLRYANWLHNGQPTEEQDNTTTEDGGYTTTAGGTAAAQLGDSDSAPLGWEL